MLSVIILHKGKIFLYCQRFNWLSGIFSQYDTILLKVFIIPYFVIVISGKRRWVDKRSKKLVSVSAFFCNVNIRIEYRI